MNRVHSFSTAPRFRSKKYTIMKKSWSHVTNHKESLSSFGIFDQVWLFSRERKRNGHTSEGQVEPPPTDGWILLGDFNLETSTAKIFFRISYRLNHRHGGQAVIMLSSSKYGTCWLQELLVKSTNNEQLVYATYKIPTCDVVSSAMHKLLSHHDLQGYKTVATTHTFLHWTHIHGTVAGVFYHLSEVYLFSGKTIVPITIPGTQHLCCFNGWKQLIRNIRRYWSISKIQHDPCPPPLSSLDCSHSSEVFKTPPKMEGTMLDIPSPPVTFYQSHSK